MANKGSILAVDDTEASLRVLSDILREAGYSVRSALRGELALRSALHQPPDLVLLDIRMPDMDGFEVCRQLKSRPETRDVPVIFISGLTETDEKVRGFEIGAVDYVTKPFQRAELLARVAAHVNLRLIQRQVTAQNEELRQYREQLEDMVALRTSELQESNRKLGLKSFALNQVREAAYLIDEKGDFRYVNQEACRAHGYSAEELTGMNVTDIDPDFTPAIFARAWQEVGVKGMVTIETRHRRRDGSVFPVEITSSCIEYEGDTLNFALARDISERKRMGAELRHQAEFQQMLLESLNDVDLQLMILENGRFIYINNRRQANEFGLSDADIDSQPPLEKYIHPDDVGRIVDQHRRRLAGEAVPRSFEIGLLTPAGERRYFDVVATTMPGSDPLRLVAILRDITERKRAEQSREEHLRFLEALDRVNRAIGSAPDLDHMAAAVLDEVLAIFACDRAFLMHPCDPEAAAWSVPMERNRPEYPGMFQMGLSLPMSDGVARTLRLLLNTNGPVQFGPGTGQPHSADIAARFGIHSAMLMALRPRIGNTWKFGIHQCSGVRNWSPREERLFDEIGRRLIDALTSLTAYRELRENERRLRESYVLLQQLTARSESAREEERKRIAREIHDELGQRLTALRIGVSTVRYRLGSQNPALTAELQDLAEQADGTIQVVRDIATALRPSVLDMGIGPALQWLVGQFGATTGIACDVTLPAEDVPLSGDAAVALFRIVQEGLTNVARHAKAKEVAVVLTHENGGCRMEIRDDGVGFDATAKRSQSFGLLGMRERIEMIGGTLVVDTQPGYGTRLRVRIPVASSQE